MKDADNQQIDHELEKCHRERDEYLNNWKRERADFVNYKKDEAGRMEEFAKFSAEAMILEVVEISDDLERAAGEVKNDGLNQVLKKIQDLFKKYGVERIVVGDRFDPLLHEAVSGGEGEKLEEVRAGYTLHGKVIRPARVKIIN